jgi:hypothetical protein
MQSYDNSPYADNIIYYLSLATLVRQTIHQRIEDSLNIGKVTQTPRAISCRFNRKIISSDREMPIPSNARLTKDLILEVSCIMIHFAQSSFYNFKLIIGLFIIKVL